MRTPGTVIRLLSVLAVAGAAGYFWTGTLTGRTARVLMRGERETARTAAPATVGTPAPAPKPVPSTPRPAPAPPATRTAPPRLEPVPAAIAAAVDSLEETGSLPRFAGNPFRGLIAISRPVISR